MRNFPSTLLVVVLFALIPKTVLCQYTETFSIANKGILSPGCSGPNLSNCNVDFTGVTWTIDGNLSEIDSEGFLTIGGVMYGADVDEEVCWVSPALNLSGPANISVDLTWTLYEIGDFIRAEYELNGNGTWVQFGGISVAAGVPEYSGGNTAIASTIGTSGNTLQVRVCGDNNLPTEAFSLDNVNVTNAFPLPVKWLNINVQNEKNKNKIYWQTATEINNDYFEVQRSMDGKDYTSVGQVKGSGNTSETTQYEFTDESIKAGNAYYYRVKQTDFDGKYDYSPIVAIRNDNNTTYEITPNPFHDFLTFTVSNQDQENEIINIFNLQGTNVKQFKNINGTVDTSDLLPGIYFIKLPLGEMAKVVKL